MSTMGKYLEYHGECSVSWGTQISKDFPTLLSIPHGTQDNPHGTEHFHSTEHPPRY